VIISEMELSDKILKRRRGKISFAFWASLFSTDREGGAGADEDPERDETVELEFNFLDLESESDSSLIG
jgi:hypothetical protein